MKTLSDVDLMEVTGGKVPNASLGVTGTSSSNNDAILASLTAIQNSIKDIGNNNNNGLFGGNAGLMFAMAIAMSRRNDTVYVGGGGGYGGCYGGGCGGGYGRVSFRWRASW